MRVLRWALLFLIVLVPLATLGHLDDLGRWDFQRSAMAGPDEFSYLLMADHFYHGGGLSLQQEIGRDTFYPPGYPLLIAGWSAVFPGGAGVTALKAHALNAALLCVDVGLVYLLARRILEKLALVGEARNWMALLVAGVFATNWHVLECSLLIMSEPLFMAVVFGWLLLGLRWRDWPETPGRAAMLGLLAVSAWAVRGAGIVCVAAMVVYAVGYLLRFASRRFGARERRCVVSVVAIVLLAGVYQAAIWGFSREKSLLARDTGNSYTQQLMYGLTDRGELSLGRPADWVPMLENLGKLVGGHVDDFASSFGPLARESPDSLPRQLVGKCLAMLAVGGWLWRMFQSRHRARADRVGGLDGGGLGFLHVFVVFYVALYLIWPFRFARFWSPIVPVMLVFAVDAVRTLARWPMGLRQRPLAVGGVVLGLLLALNVEEAVLQLGNYARRLNYVSDCLALTAGEMVRRSPDPQKTIVAVMDDETHFAMAWYLMQATPGSDRGRRYVVRSRALGRGKSESTVEMLQRSVAEMDKVAGGGGRVYFVSYFEHAYAYGTLERLPMAYEALSRLQREVPGIIHLRAPPVIFQKEIITALWEISAPHTR